MAEKTIHERKGIKYIWVYTNVQMRPVMAIRLSRTEQLKCKHKWCPVGLEGHGKWRSGCSKCGALSR
jgi:hypothetical protein